MRLLKVSGEVRERYQRRYRYLLVDEYQDTNRPQYELMKLLAGEAKNVCAVGDEDQSIYSWRGADIRNILEFEKDFPNAQDRAAGAELPVDAGDSGGGGRGGGQQHAPQGEEAVDGPPGRKPDWLLRGAGRRERGAVYRRPHSEVSARGRRARNDGEAHCAVLYRTNSQSRLVEEALRRYNIRYTMVGGFSFYERAEIKDLLGYLRLVRNPHDSMALQRVINTPARGIGKTTLETLERLALETGKSTWDATGAAIANRLIPTRALMAIEAFRQLILDAQAMMDPDFAGKLAADVRGARTQMRIRVCRGLALPGRRVGRCQRRLGDELRLRREREADSAAGLVQAFRRLPDDAEAAVSDDAEEDCAEHAKLKPRKKARGEAGVSGSGGCGDAAGADPVSDRPHRVHQGAGD